MNFGKALEALKAGYQVKLPSWAGYWQKEGDTPPLVTVWLMIGKLWNNPLRH